MCADPVTIGIMVAAGAGPAIGAGVKAKEEWDASKFAEAQSDFNASVAESNAEDALRRGKDAASDAIGRGEFNASRIQGEGAKAESAAIAAAGASGLDVSSASFMDLVGGSRAAAELDALVVRNDAAREAWGHQTNADREAKALKAQAGQLRGQAQRLRDGRTTQLVGTLLGGAAQTAGAVMGRK